MMSSKLDWLEIYNLYLLAKTLLTLKISYANFHENDIKEENGKHFKTGAFLSTLLSGG